MVMWLWTLSTENINGDIDEDNGKTTVKSSDYTLEYDAAGKIAQGLGAHLNKLQSLNRS